MAIRKRYVTLDEVRATRPDRVAHACSLTGCTSTFLPTFWVANGCVSAQDLSDACRRAWLTLLCAPCQRDFGTGEIALVCPSLCSSIYSACRSDWFTVAGTSAGGLGSTGLLTPCERGSLICGRLRDMVSNGSALCAAAGLRVAPVELEWDHDGEDGSAPRCFTGAPAVRRVHDSASQQASSRRAAEATPWHAHALTAVCAAGAVAAGLAVQRWWRARPSRHELALEALRARRVAKLDR